ncbi:hypothetical protein IA54_004220 [Xanthomonas phaseoli pv. syngonii LMG 9055]|uniref:Uncharacterized protein n=1 Tax=Xanthomonas phaseoli pv. syngonii LMG 9055 TaxID=1437878 RepID=A0A1V9HE45_9XANT|nr:hypothetical protein IA54_004220 [Xanthomonas phaseoli pv. syngonii LMG 9055]
MGIALILLMILDSGIEYSEAAEALPRAGALMRCKQRAGTKRSPGRSVLRLSLVALPRIG